MAGINWADTALIELDDIADYIALHNPAAARALVQRIFDKVERVRDFPRSGRKIPELTHLDYRELVINPCRVIYRMENESIMIVHVMRQERELRRYVLGEKE